MGNKKGFTLLELVIVLTMIGILTGAVLPNYLEGLRVKLAGMTGEEMREIQNAALKCYVDTQAWPVDMAALKAAGYLNADWNGLNKFGNAYVLSSDANSLTVTTTVPAQYTGVVAQAVSQPVIDGVTVSTTIPVPGSISAAQGVPSGTIIVWDNSHCGTDETCTTDGCPEGYTRASAMDGRTLRGSSAFNVAAGGSDTHLHNAGDYTSPAHTHGVGSYAAAAHSHTYSGATTGIGSARGSARTRYHDIADGTGGYEHYYSGTTSSNGASLTGVSGSSGALAITGNSAAANSWPPYSDVLYCQKD